jgi:hypothetical protein
VRFTKLAAATLPQKVISEGKKLIPEVSGKLSFLSIYKNIDEQFAYNFQSFNFANRLFLSKRFINC